MDRPVDGSVDGPRATARLRLVALAVAVVLAAGSGYTIVTRDDDATPAARTSDGLGSDDEPAADQPAGASTAPRPDPGGPAPTTTVVPLRSDVLVDPAIEGRPWGDAVEGVLTFRGNPTRTFYGRGPVPVDPVVRWSYPASPMCASSSEYGESRTWCGTGWTGQPAVFERDGRTWVVFGAYDRAVHFVDGDSGAAILAPFVTGDLAKGSVTVDPDGYPLVYAGSRDGHYRVLAIDRDEPLELWRLSATDVAPTMWNDDWDASALVLEDHLVQGGENSQFHVVRLRRGHDADGFVTVDPELVFHAPGWDDELLAAIGDRRVSIESSVTVVGDTAYFANSGGLVQGWDLGPLRTGTGVIRRTFRFWTGDDTDATIVADAEGMLYVASEWERFTDRARDVGQIMKLDPTRPDDPLVWSIPDQPPHKAGVWATPALHGDLLIVPTYNGRILGIDRTSGEVRWERHLPPPLMGSPVVVDDVWIQGDCAGGLHAFDVSDPMVEPPELWTVEIGGCIEATPTVWDGTVYVGTRAGRFHAIADPR